MDSRLVGQMCWKSSLSCRATIAAIVSLPSCRTASMPHYSHAIALAHIDPLTADLLIENQLGQH